MGALFLCLAVHGVTDMKNARRSTGIDSHFRIHDEREYRIAFKERSKRCLSARIMCEARGATHHHYLPVDQTFVLSKTRVVSCFQCTLIKEAWLERTDLRPLTLRRLRALKDQMAEATP